ncbi:MAG: M48 family peptidase, partial [Betaproteobacteria bacterium]|nr:M48 family peptidase [Betaproteobacteria bacterium]
MCFICDFKTSASTVSGQASTDTSPAPSPRWQARRAFLLAAGA